MSTYYDDNLCDSYWSAARDDREEYRTLIKTRVREIVADAYATGRAFPMATAPGIEDHSRILSFFPEWTNEMIASHEPKDPDAYPAPCPPGFCRCLCPEMRACSSAFTGDPRLPCGFTRAEGCMPTTFQRLPRGQKAWVRVSLSEANPGMGTTSQLGNESRASSSHSTNAKKPCF